MMVRKFATDGTKIDPEKLAAWLDTQWKGDKRCPICKSNDWSISDRALELREWSRIPSLNPPSYKIVAMIQCSVCGNTIFINPFTAGLLEDEPSYLTPVLAQDSKGK
jgi:hypothetical protein